MSGETAERGLRQSCALGDGRRRELVPRGRLGRDGLVRVGAGGAARSAASTRCPPATTLTGRSALRRSCWKTSVPVAGSAPVGSSFALGNPRKTSPIIVLRFCS